MAKSNRTHRSAICFFIAIILLFGASGCYVTLQYESVLWSPNSTKILYADHDGARLVEYDLAQQVTRVIVADTQTKTTWPAIRSDGQRLAVCKIDVQKRADSDDEIHLRRIKIYDLNGQLVQQSSSLESKQKKSSNSSLTINRTSIESGLNWSGPHNKILMIDAIYDCDSDNWTSLKDLFPFAINNSPVRPDGRGFLGCAPDGSFVFVDWNGVVSQFNESPTADPARPSPSTKLPDDQIWLNFRWNNDVAEIEYPDQVFEFDTSTFKVSSRASTLPGTKQGSEIQSVYRFSGTDSQLYLVKNGFDQSLIFQTPKFNLRKVLFKQSEVNWSGLTFFESPDKRSVAMRYRLNKSDGPSVILIINDQGSVISVATE